MDQAVLALEVGEDEIGLLADQCDRLLTLWGLEVQLAIVTGGVTHRQRILGALEDLQGDQGVGGVEGGDVPGLFASLPAVDQGASLGLEVQGQQVLEGEVGEVQGQGEGIAARHRLAQIVGLVGSRSGGERGTVKHGVEGRVLIGVGRALIAEGVELGEGPQQHPGVAQLGGAVHDLQLADGTGVVLAGLGHFHLMREVDNPLGRIVLRGDFGAQGLAVKAELTLQDGELVDGLLGQHHAVEAVGGRNPQLVLAVLIHGGGRGFHLFIGLGHVHAPQEVLGPHHFLEQDAAHGGRDQQVVTAAPAQGGVVAEVGGDLGLDALLVALGGLDGDLVTVDRGGVHGLGELRVGGGVGQGEGIHALGNFIGGEADGLGHGQYPFAQVGQGAATGLVLRPVYQMGAHAGLVVEGVHCLFGVFIGFDAGGEVERGRLVGAVGVQHIQIQTEGLGQRLAGELEFGVGQHVGGGVERLVLHLDGSLCGAAEECAGDRLHQYGFSHVLLTILLILL